MYRYCGRALSALISCIIIQSHHSSLYATVIVPSRRTSLLLALTSTPNSPLGTVHTWPSTSQIARSLFRREKVAVPESPAVRRSLVKPRSWRTGALADAGKARYSCTTSAPASKPLLVMVAVTVATSSYRSSRPPGTTGPVAGPEVADESTDRSA